MGWTPGQLYRASYAEFVHCSRGWIKAQGGDPDAPAARPAALSRAEYEKMKEKLYGQ